MSSIVERAPRGQFDGVLQIVRYNWTLYLVAVLVSTLVVLLVDVVHPPAALAGLLILGAVAAGFLLALLLALSHYLYDPSPPYRLGGIPGPVLPRPPPLGDIHPRLDAT